MSEDHDSIVIARLRDTAENIHSRGPVIAAQHLRDAADRIAGQRQQIEALEAANASLATDAGLWAKAPGPAITCDPRIRSGWPCIAGTRIGVELAAGDIEAGETVEQYAADKQVTVEQVREALAVYEGMRPLFDALEKEACELCGSPLDDTGNCNRRDCEWAAPAANGAP